MYDLETVKSTLKTRLMELTDPYDTSENPSKVFGNVIRGHPDIISLFDGPLATIIWMANKESPFGTNKKSPINAVVNNQGNKRQSWIAELTGAIVFYVPGNDDSADTVATQLSDIVSDFFKDENALGLSGVSLKPLTEGNSMAWFPLAVTLKNEQEPVKSLSAAIKYKITINDNKKH